MDFDINLIDVNFTKYFPKHLSFANVGTSKVLTFVNVSLQIIFAKFTKDHLMFEIKNQNPTNA